MTCAQTPGEGTPQLPARGDLAPGQRTPLRARLANGVKSMLFPVVSSPGSQPRLQPHGGHREAETRENRAGPAWPRGVPQSGRSAVRDRVRAENGADPQHLVKLPQVGFPEGRGCAPPAPPHPDDFTVQSVLRPGSCQLQDTPFSALDSPPPPTKEGGITVPPRHERRGFSIPGKERCVEPPVAALRGVCGSVLPTASGAPGSQPSSAAAASAPAFGPPGMAGPRLYLRWFPVRFGGQTTNASPSGLSRRKAGPGCKPRRRLSCLKARLSNTGSGQGL